MDRHCKQMRTAYRMSNDTDKVLQMQSLYIQMLGEVIAVRHRRLPNKCMSGFSIKVIKVYL